jgi:TATA-binding protein-associated factor
MEPGVTRQGPEKLTQIPEKLKVNFKLHDFQRVALRKLTSVANGLCGDDMGLGKTLTGIAVDRQKRLALGPEGRPGKTLVITTLTGTDVWTEHYRWAMPNMKTITIDPKDRSSFIGAVKTGSADVYICHWDSLRLMPELAKRQWFHIIGDEIHKVKNRKAQVTRALKKIRTQHKLAMSGTPGDNLPQDIWSILHWLYPQKYSSYWAFFKYYCDYQNLETKDGNGYRKITGVRNEKHLQKDMAPFFIRRRKEEVAKELPEKYYDQIWVDLSPSQRKAYNDMRREQLAWIGTNLDTPIAAPIAITQLIRLQQFAVASVDVQVVRKLVKNHSFEYWLARGYPETPVNAENLGNPRRIWADVPEYNLIDPSTKLNAVEELALGMEGSLVIFTQFVDVVTLLRQRMAKAKIPVSYITGDVSKPNRDAMVRKFQAGETKLFIGTIGSCRESITLTKAYTEVFVDRAWSPSWNLQAEDRCHRIGQTNAVQVIDIMAKNTIDLGRHQQIQMKWTWLQKMFGDKTLDYQKAITEKGMKP